MKNLMLDDLVRIKAPDKYAGAIGKICSLTTLEGGYFDINIQDDQYGYLMTSVFNEDIEPIPITPEILLKIGFKLSQRDKMHGIGIFKGNGETYEVEYKKSTSQSGKVLGIKLLSNRYTRKTYNLRLPEFLHELQHAFNDMKIRYKFQL